jgi:hypothetical protein
MVRPVEFLYSLYDALVSINVPNDKARAVVDAMERDMSTHLATKTDIDSHRLALKGDIDAVRVALKSDISAMQVEIDSLRVTTRTDLDAFRRDVDSGFALLRQEMKSDFALLRKDMDAQKSRITIHLGSLIVVMTGLILTALQLR